MSSVKVLGWLFIVILVGAFGYFVSGSYQVGADKPHWTVTEKLFAFVRHRAVARHSHGVQVPGNLDDPGLAARGGGHYEKMCSACHLRPGLRESEIYVGLYPQPPNLTKHAVHDEAQAYWVIKHGIKMSGMPAWGKSHSDEDIWAIVAFLRKLPGMSPHEYKTVVGGGRGRPQGGAANTTKQTITYASENGLGVMLSDGHAPPGASVSGPSVVTRSGETRGMPRGRLGPSI